jgi:hypothetical protein
MMISLSPFSWLHNRKWLVEGNWVGYMSDSTSAATSRLLPLLTVYLMLTTEFTPSGWLFLSRSSFPTREGGLIGLLRDCGLSGKDQHVSSANPKWEIRPFYDWDGRHSLM